MIHSSAIVHPKAQVDPSTDVGPYVVIDEHVVIGPECHIGPYVHLSGHTLVGAGNIFHSGCVVGDAPQDIRYTGERTRLRIGDRNVFREHVTVHRSNTLSEETIIGSNNYFMAHSHVGHNVQVGNHVIIANGALLGGHACVADRAFISGNCLVHQFARVGSVALMQGGSGISKDLPPFTIARGNNGICGLNVVGLRRAGVTSEERLELKELYHLLFRSGIKLQFALDKARSQFLLPRSLQLIEFVASAKRGLCSDPGKAQGGSPSESPVPENEG